MGEKRRVVCSFSGADRGAPAAAARPRRRVIHTEVTHVGSRIRGESGSFLVLAMIALTVLLILGSVSVQVAMQSLHRATKEKQSSVAFNLAESAADCAEAWLRAQSAPPLFYGAVDPLGGERTLDGGIYSALIYSDAGNPGVWLKSYTIVGTGRAAQGGVTRKVILKVQEQSFALYSYFTDQERSSVTNGTIWFYARDRLWGPVHSNDRIHVAWSSTSADPIFYDTVSSASTSVSWDPRAPRNANEWRRVLQGGQDALTLGADDMPLPDSTDRQKIAAWGSEYGFPTSTGVSVPNTGSAVTAGIYVTGDSQIQFSADTPTGNQIVAIKQGSKTTTITVDLAANQTTVADGTPGSPYYYTGIPNGVIYSTGNITSLEGTLANNYENGSTILQRNAWTVATDVNAGKDINITDNLTYGTPPDSSKPPTHPSNLRAPTLGLVAEDVIVDGSCPNEMTINGVIVAGGQNTTYGSFYYEEWDNVKRNNLHILGGIIQKKRGPVGTFGSNNVHLTGYNKDYHYDQRMVNSPPPFFPTTGQYDVKSWQTQ
jgi:type II secretory pathway pseudopilin PulG